MRMPTDQEYEVNYEISVHFNYRLIFTEHLFRHSNPDLIHVLNPPDRVSTPARVLVFIDLGLLDAQPGLKKDVEDYFYFYRAQVNLVAPPILVPGGEAAKSDSRLFDRLVQSIHDAQICRHSFVMTVGGGSVIDVVGFAASIVHRGVRQIRVPTTVLAQDDAGIGIKNGMNAFGKKNFLGTFAPPFAVLSDPQFLTTLDQANWIGGISEAIKVALLKDAEFFAWIDRSATLLRDRDLGVMRVLIQKCAELHLRHITTSGDPFEQGSARPLDFGHWSAHKLEQLSEYELGHGHAVATGIAIDLLYAQHQKWIAPERVSEILACMTTIGFRLWRPILLRKNPETDRYLILEGIEEFREHLGGSLNITLIQEAGIPFQIDTLDSTGVMQAVFSLRDRFSGDNAPS
jgi:3-dehydroquinate synthase